MSHLRTRGWLEQDPAPDLKSADGLLLAVAHRHGLAVVTADQTLIKAAGALQIPAQQAVSP